MREHEDKAGAAGTAEGVASGTVDLVALATAVNQMQQNIDSISEIVNKGAVSSETVGKAQTDRQKILDITDPGHDEAWKAAVLRGDVNAKAFMDDSLIDLSYSRKQMLTHQANLNAAVIDNLRNQQAQNNAVSMNGIDHLQNDVEDSVKLGTVLDRLMTRIEALSQK